MTREEAANRLNEFLWRQYPQMVLTADDLVISRYERGVWLFKQACTGLYCRIKHPPDLVGPIHHRVVFMDWQQTPETCEEWKILNTGTCRVCGSPAYFKREKETLVFHYPESIERKSWIVEYAICEKCGKVRVI